MYPTPESLWQKAWQLLEAAPEQSDHPFRLASLATVDAQQRPKARTVVLRAADAMNGSLTFYTDLRSAKVAEFTLRPTVHWLFWDAGHQLQVSASGRVARISRTEEQALFAALPKHGRKAYATVLPPGTPLAPEEDPLPANWDRLTLAETGFIRNHFGVFTTRLLAADLLCLHREGHQRLRAERSALDADWQLNWVTP